MKKVLFLTNYPAPYRVNFFSILGKYCDLTVLFIEKPEEQSHRNTEWFSSQYDNFKPIFLKKIKLFEKNFSFEAISWVKREYDLIILGGYSDLTSQMVIEYMRIRKIGFYLEIDGGVHKDGKGIIEKWKKHLISSAKCWISPSKISDEYLCFYGAKQKNIVRYPFTSLLDQDILNKSLTFEQKQIYKENLGILERKMVLTVGQFIPRKANDVLIMAAQYLEKDTGVYIVGGIPPKEYVELVNRLRLSNIHFIDFKEREKLTEFYKAADVFAMPTREDIWGLVINEAMACGLPIVSTNKCVAALELVREGENGFIVESDNAKALADKINYLLDNENVCLKMGEKNLSIINNYTIENMVKVHMNIIDET